MVFLAPDANRPIPGRSGAAGASFVAADRSGRDYIATLTVGGGWEGPATPEPHPGLSDHRFSRSRKCRSAKSRNAFQSAGTAMCPRL